MFPAQHMRTNSRSTMSINIDDVIVGRKRGISESYYAHVSGNPPENLNESEYSPTVTSNVVDREKIGRL